MRIQIYSNITICLVVLLKIICRATPSSPSTIEGGNIKNAYFAAGCYWSIELAYQRIPGVLETSVGFCGGETVNPTYRQVTSGRTGHAETVEIQYNEDVVSYTELLKVFFSLHDPTTLNRQGNDLGTQYRSAIFPVDESQKQNAIDFIASLTKQNVYSKPIVTSIEMPFQYTRAGEDHQKYLQKSGQSSTKGSLNPIQCYGNRGPIKDLKKSVHDIFLKNEL